MVGFAFPIRVTMNRRLLSFCRRYHYDHFAVFSAPLCRRGASQSRLFQGNGISRSNTVGSLAR
jgi:hypothetical protein